MGFHMVLYFGYLYRMHKEAENEIVSNDKGFDNIFDFWVVRGRKANRIGCNIRNFRKRPLEKFTSKKQKTKDASLDNTGYNRADLKARDIKLVVNSFMATKRSKSIVELGSYIKKKKYKKFLSLKKVVIEAGFNVDDTGKIRKRLEGLSSVGKAKPTDTIEDKRNVETEQVGDFVPVTIFGKLKIYPQCTEPAQVMELDEVCSPYIT